MVVNNTDYLKDYSNCEILSIENSNEIIAYNDIVNEVKKAELNGLAPQKIKVLKLSDGIRKIVFDKTLMPKGSYLKERGAEYNFNGWENPIQTLLPSLETVIWPEIDEISLCLFARTKIKHIIFNHCKKIDDYAFFMSEIEDFNFCGVEEIGVNAFNSTNIEILDLTQSLVKEIHLNCFAFCYKLQSVDFGPVNKIEDGSFYSCLNLETIEIPETVIFIGDSAFAASGIKKAIINASTLGTHATFMCCPINGIKINDNIQTIPSRCFYNCTNLTHITLPKSLTSIKEEAFGGSSITKISIPDSVINIGRRAFMSCKRLTNVKWSKNCKTISEQVFFGNVRLKQIKQTECVENIESSAFFLCPCDIILCNIKILSISAFFSYKGCLDATKCVFFDDLIIDRLREINSKLPYYIE